MFLLLGRRPGKTKRPAKAFLWVDEVYAAGVEPVDGVLLLVDAANPYNVGIPAGQSVEVQFTVDDDLAAVWAEQGVTPATAESVAYQD